MDPAIWGPDQWKVLFDTAKIFEECREKRDAVRMNVCKDFLKVLAKNFLCEHCGYFFGERLAMYNNSMDMVDWVYNLKHLVSNKIYICRESTKACTLKTLPCDSISRVQFYNKMFYEDYHLDSWERNLVLIMSLKNSDEFFEASKRMFETFFGLEKGETVKTQDEFCEYLFRGMDYKSWVDGYITCQKI